MPRKRLILAFVIFACLSGALISYFLLLKHEVKHSGLTWFDDVCEGNSETGSARSCDAVVASPWGTFPPIPREESEDGSEPESDRRAAEAALARQYEPRPLPILSDIKMVPRSVALFGMMYFSALATWYLAVGRVTYDRRHWHLVPLLLNVAGVAGVLFFLYLMFFTDLDEWCPWCLVAHALNVAALVGALLLRPRADQAAVPAPEGSEAAAPHSASHPSRRFALVTLATMAGVAAAELWFHDYAAEHRGRRQYQIAFAAAAKAHAELEESIRQHAGTLHAIYEQGELLDIPIRPDDPVKNPNATDAVMVIITDFRCPHCARFAKYTDDVLEPMFGDRLKIVFKHYPASPECNPYMSRNMHPAACEASKAAEAARLLGGSDAFWKAHDLLFANQARMTNPARYLPELAKALGFEWEAFREAMDSATVTNRIREDIELARKIRLRGTPSPYLNGRHVPSVCRSVDVFWREVERRMTRQVWELYEKNPRVRFRLRPDEPVTAVGAGKQALTAVVFGDFADERSQALAALFDERVKPLFNGQLRIVYKYLPNSTDCNPYASGDAVPAACVAARAVEAARVLGGNEAFWEAHDIFYNAQKFNMMEKMDYAKVALKLKLDAAQYVATMESDAVRKRIAEDVELARTLSVSKAPTVFVSNREVPADVLFDMGFWEEAARRFEAIVRAQEARKRQATSQPAGAEPQEEATEGSPDP
ncbi:MAG: thioredoxin domain-containing protein [Phycisphaerae bacterium]|nr:thioredoxin domain-containing protein [Phycisphaerae bacterium]